MLTCHPNAKSQHVLDLILGILCYINFLCVADDSLLLHLQSSSSWTLSLKQLILFLYFVPSSIATFISSHNSLNTLISRRLLCVIFGMGRRSGQEASMMIGSGSSIALLQERFKQLERVRERREEKELLNLFCVADKRIISPTDTTSLFEPRVKLQQEGHQLEQTQGHDPLSLELGGCKKLKDEDSVRAMKNVCSNWCTPGKKNVVGSHESSDIDTTLRL
ncbi:hypothetical protein QQ045_015114 [Rhodiola kirilowii]